MLGHFVRDRFRIGLICLLLSLFSLMKGGIKGRSDRANEDWEQKLFHFELFFYEQASPVESLGAGDSGQEPRSNLAS